MKKVQLVDDEERVVFMNAVADDVWEKIHRILELTRLSDEVTPALDTVINLLEEPKKEVASKIASKMASAKNLSEVFAKALMVLPKKDLEQLSKHVENIKIERKPGHDCLIVKTDEKALTLPL